MRGLDLLASVHAACLALKQRTQLGRHSALTSRKLVDTRPVAAGKTGHMSAPAGQGTRLTERGLLGLMGLHCCCDVQ